MEDIPLFTELRYDSGVYVHTSNHISVERDCRVYYEATGRKLGFDFYVTDFVSSSGNTDDPYDDPGLRVECLFNGVAMFDGIRHLYMGDKTTDNEGYLYYPSSMLIAKVFAALRVLEERFCNKDMLSEWDAAANPTN